VRIVLPPALAERARRVACGDIAAAPLEPAATVALIRPAGGDVEVYLQHRHRGLAFAGGMHAFPGGRVDDFDATSPAEAQAHLAAAVREVAEETGVEVDPAGMVGWSRWVTPRFERRRFDAWFFVAPVPVDQEPRALTGESHDGVWIRPATALVALRQGSLAMLPPTWWTLREIAERGPAERVLRDPPAMQRHTVGWTVDGADVVMALPGDPAYPGDDPREGT
jgi:8-oxo-dGTP pyrophosphatase MutT (NUDIX family)